jgi:hypothetical protein
LVSFVTYKIPTAIKDYFPIISKINVQHIGNSYADKLTTVLPQAFAGKKNGATKILLMHR